jgi:hypothetical protein
MAGFLFPPKVKSDYGDVELVMADYTKVMHVYLSPKEAVSFAEKLIKTAQKAAAWRDAHPGEENF